MLNKPIPTIKRNSQSTTKQSNDASLLIHCPFLKKFLFHMKTLKRSASWQARAPGQLLRDWICLFVFVPCSQIVFLSHQNFKARCIMASSRAKPTSHIRTERSDDNTRKKPCSVLQPRAHHCWSSLWSSSSSSSSISSSSALSYNPELIIVGHRSDDHQQ